MSAYLLALELTASPALDDDPLCTHHSGERPVDRTRGRVTDTRAATPRGERELAGSRPRFTRAINPSPSRRRSRKISRPRIARAPSPAHDAVRGIDLSRKLIRWRGAPDPLTPRSRSDLLVDKMRCAVFIRRSHRTHTFARDVLIFATFAVRSGAIRRRAAKDMSTSRGSQSNADGK